MRRGEALRPHGIRSHNIGSERRLDEVNAWLPAWPPRAGDVLSSLYRFGPKHPCRTREHTTGGSGQSAVHVHPRGRTPMSARFDAPDMSQGEVIFAFRPKPWMKRAACAGMDYEPSSRSEASPSSRPKRSAPDAPSELPALTTPCPSTSGTASERHQRKRTPSAPTPTGVDPSRAAPPRGTARLPTPDNQSCGGPE
jgi:hypothetical protein